MPFLKFKHATVVLAIAFLVAFASQFTFGQTRKKQTFAQFFEAITSPDTTTYRVEYVDFIDPMSSAEFLHSKRLQLNSDSLIVVNKIISLFDCRFADGLSLSRFHFKKNFSLQTSTWMSKTVYPDELSLFMIDGNTFAGGLSIQFEKGQVQPLLNMQQNTVQKKFHLIAEDAYIDLQNNKFDLKAKNQIIKSHSSLNEAYDKPSFEKKQIVDFYISARGHRFSFNKNNIVFQYNEAANYIQSYQGYLYLNTTDVTLSGNKFESAIVTSQPPWTNTYSLQLILQEEVRMFEFTHNTFQPDLFLQIGYDLNNLRIHNNALQRVAFNQFRIPDQSNVVLWSDLGNAQVGLATGDYGITKPYYSATAEEIPDNLSFRELLKFYKKIYDEYKAAGDIQSSNQVYIKMKDLETSELRNSYKSDPSFNLWFRVKLNQLLKYYTAYGTDPAQALVASFWIIFAFAIFYFFFPSTWDVSSKSRLLQDFKDFIEKNEKGYVKPFFKMSGGFLLSLLNAATLSLNAFVTLGFGEIPARGAAKYITVVEGFLGWFLLSIFTVSLVSQLLF